MPKNNEKHCSFCGRPERETGGMVQGLNGLICRDCSERVAEVYHDIEFDSDLLIGVWKEDELYYRYNEDGTGVTWDLADDVLEDEGTEIDWTLEYDQFVHYYHMEIGGIIPKTYNMKVLELDYMEYEDDYGVNHKFNKVEELQLIN